LIPRHPCEQHGHPAGVGDPGEDQTAAHETGQAGADGSPAGVGPEGGEGCTSGDEAPGGNSHLPLERHRPASPDNRQAGGLAGGRAPLDAHDIRDAGGEQLLTSLLTAASRLADEVHGATVAEPGNVLGLEPIERNIVGEVDVNFAIFRRRADVDERDFLTAAAEIGEHRGGDGGDHGRVLREGWP